MKYRKLRRDESGIALPIAIFVMVLIGVMGAGLLVFVRNDLEAVIEVNRGQKATEIAEAGVAAAKRQLKSDNVRRHYDATPINDCLAGQRVEVEEDWSPATTGSNADCTDVAVPKPSGPGVRKDFAGGRFVVTIQCYKQEAVDTTCAGIDESAPGSETVAERRYFKITSRGYFPADGSGAVRTVQAIYYTASLPYPTAYYSFKNIEFVGNASVRGVSFFAKQNIVGTQGGSVTIDRIAPALYTHWNTTLLVPPSQYNTVTRTDLAGSPLVGVGFGAEGLVCADKNCTSSGADGYNDYDSTTGTKGKNLKFQRKPTGAANTPNAAGTISHPFDPPGNLNTDLPIAYWEEDAREQGTYKTPAQIGNKIDNSNWPATQTPRNVFFVEAGGQTIDIDYRVDKSPIVPEGVIVVRNGNLSISNASNGFKGIIVVTGDGTNTGNYTSTGNDTVTGFVIADGTMKIGGTVEPSVAVGDFSSMPAYHSVNLWSWRECYSVNCN